MGFREYHHLDASVYIEAVDRELNNDYSLTDQYISKLGRTFQCGFSIVIIGEIFKVLIRKVSKEDIGTFVIFLKDFLIKQKIQLFSLTDEDVELFTSLREFESHADTPELLALATAIRNKADVFMTYDKKLLESSGLFKSQFGIKVRRPY